ncbi:MAG: lysyl oxidase family protein, partial [Nocardioides sp.]
YCAGAWFTKSTVFGIERGWAVPVGSFLEVKTKLKEFDVSVSISDPVADFLGIPAAARTVTQHVVVEDEGCAFGCRSARAEQVRATTDLPAAMAPDSAPTRRTTPATAAGAPAADTLPDLVSVPAWHISTTRGRVDRLNFNAHEWNAGAAPLVVEGYRRGTQPLMDAYQVFYRNGKPVRSKKTGTFEFHDVDSHNHWHFSDFAKYELVKPGGALVTTSGKQSWCLAPTDAVNLRLTGAAWRPDSTGLTSTCGEESALWLRQTMPVGWGDTYNQYQTEAFDLTGVPNGTYQIKITVNPNGNLFEKTKANNVSLRTVKIGGRPGARTVTVPPYQGIDTENLPEDEDE